MNDQPATSPNPLDPGTLSKISGSLLVDVAGYRYAIMLHLHPEIEAKMAGVSEKEQLLRLTTLFGNVRVDIQDLGPIPNPEEDGLDDYRAMFETDVE